MIQGTDHRGTYNQFKRSNPQDIASKRTCLTDRISFDLSSEIGSRIDYSKIEPIDKLVKRDFISFFLLYPTANQGQVSNRDLMKECDSLARLLTEVEVSSIFDRLQNLQDYLSDKNNRNFIDDYTLKQLNIIGEWILEKHPLKSPAK